MPLHIPIKFPGSDDQALTARLDIPVERQVKAYALFAHFSTCPKDLFGTRYISAALAKRGIVVLRFDFTGLSHSKREFENTNFITKTQDVLAAEYLRREKEAPQLLSR